MNVIDLFGTPEKEQSLTKDEKVEKLNKFIERMKQDVYLSPHLTNDDQRNSCLKKLELTLSLIEKLKPHAEYIKYLLNFDQKNNLSIVNAIVFVLENEKNELHRNEIYERIKMLNLSKPYVEKHSFIASLGYLRRIKKIANGKKRGYWRAVQTDG